MPAAVAPREFPASRPDGVPIGAVHRGPPSRFYVFPRAAALLKELGRYAYAKKNGSTPAISTGVVGVSKKIGEPRTVAPTVELLAELDLALAEVLGFAGRPDMLMGRAKKKRKVRPSYLWLGRGHCST